MPLPPRFAAVLALLTLAACSAPPRAEEGGPARGEGEGGASGRAEDGSRVRAEGGGPAGVSPAPASLIGVLVALNVSWGDRYAAGDAEALAGMYAPDAVLMTPDGDVAGAAAIRHRLAAEFAARRDTILATRTETETVDVAGDRAYEAGTITYTTRLRDGTGPERLRRVRYMTWWERGADGAWRIRRSLRIP